MTVSSGDPVRLRAYAAHLRAGAVRIEAAAHLALIAERRTSAGIADTSDGRVTPILIEVEHVVRRAARASAEAAARAHDAASFVDQVALAFEAADRRTSSLGAGGIYDALRALASSGDDRGLGVLARQVNSAARSRHRAVRLAVHDALSDLGADHDGREALRLLVSAGADLPPAMLGPVVLDCLVGHGTDDDASTSTVSTWLHAQVDDPDAPVLAALAHHPNLVRDLLEGRHPARSSQRLARLLARRGLDSDAGIAMVLRASLLGPNAFDLQGRSTLEARRLIGTVLASLAEQGHGPTGSHLNATVAEILVRHPGAFEEEAADPDRLVVLVQALESITRDVSARGLLLGGVILRRQQLLTSAAAGSVTVASAALAPQGRVQAALDAAARAAGVTSDAWVPAYALARALIAGVSVVIGGATSGGIGVATGVALGGSLGEALVDRAQAHYRPPADPGPSRQVQSARRHLRLDAWAALAADPATAAFLTSPHPPGLPFATARPTTDDLRRLDDWASHQPAELRARLEVLLNGFDATLGAANETLTSDR